MLSSEQRWRLRPVLPPVHFTTPYVLAMIAGPAPGRTVSRGSGSYVGAANPANVTTNAPIAVSPAFWSLLGAGTAPPRFALRLAGGNPSHDMPRFAVELPRAGRTRLHLFDAMGRIAARPWEGERGPGRYAVAWDALGGRRLAAGVYVVGLLLDGERCTTRLGFLP
jgi:hypothetical protein